MHLLVKVIAIASVLLAGGAQATFIDAEGVAGQGLNDNIANAMDVGSINGNGFFFDIDFAEDIGANSNDDEGLDTEIGIFNSLGVLIANNDDNDFFETGIDNAGTDPGSDAFADRDSFIGELFLNSGGYYIAVSYFNNNALSEFDETQSMSISGDLILDAVADDAFENNETCSDLAEDQCSGDYQLQIRNYFEDYAGQVTVQGWIGSGTDGNDVDFYQFNVVSVPTPSVFALLIFGLAGLRLTRRA